MTVESHRQEPRLMMLLNSVSRLPERMRLLFELLFVAGLTDEQAAGKMSMDVPTLWQEKILLMRSLKSLSA